MSSPEPTPVVPEPVIAPASAAEIDCSCRAPVLALFVTALGWLVLATAFGLLASLKFHRPQLLAECPVFTYGRVHAAQLNMLAYGFAVPAALGVTLWLMARLGRTPLEIPGLPVVGALGWNIGMLFGIGGILAGDSTGFEWLEMPNNAGGAMFAGYLLIGISAFLTFHARRVRELYPSQWFLFAALLWLPWSLSSARLLLVRWPVSGGAQSAIALWYAHNFTVVWVSLMGLAILFYFLPKLSGQPLASRPMALFTFWGLVLLGGWGGVHSAAPLPRWLSAVSTAANVLLIVPVLAAGLNYRQTIDGREDVIREQPGGRFFLVAGVAYLLWALIQAGCTVRTVNEMSEFTHFATAVRQGGLIAFLGLALFGAIHYIAPRLAGGDWPMERLVSWQFVAAVSGVILYLGSLTGAGIMQGFALNDPSVSFFESTRRSLMFFRFSTAGDVLFFVSAVLLFVNLVALLWQGCRQCCLSSGPVNSKSKVAGVTV